MNIGDKIVCIKSFYIQDFESNGYRLEGINLQIGDICTITSIKDYTGEGLTKYNDIQIFIISNSNERKWSFYSRELKYRHCIYDHFILLAPFRDKRIDDILND